MSMARPEVTGRRAGFSTIVVADFEYEVGDGELPNVLCMVAHVLDGGLRHVRTIRQRRGEFGTTPPFDVGPNTLFVAYSAWAEMQCFSNSGCNSLPISSICTPLFWRPAISCCRITRTKCASDKASGCRTPAVPSGSRVGNASTGLDRQGYRRGTLARLRTGHRLRLLRRRRAHVRAAAAQANTRLEPVSCLQHRTCAALVRLQRQSDRSEFKRTVCRSTLISGTWCRSISRKSSAP